MQLLGSEVGTVDGVLVRPRDLAGGVVAEPGRRSLTIRGTRGDAAVEDFLARSGLRITASVDLEVPPCPTASGSRGDAPTPTPAVVLTPPELEPDELAQVALVQENGELRWVFGDDGEFVVEITDHDASGRGDAPVVRRAVRFVALTADSGYGESSIGSFVAAAEERLRPHRVRPVTPENFRRHVETEAVGDELADGPILVVVHGVMSRTDHAIGGLPDELVRRTYEDYGRRTVAFDHPTLAVDPRQNAQQLARFFTDQVAPHVGDGGPVPIDIVAHSRGGLVARELVDLLSGSDFWVRSIVFIATPNSGTPLASADHLGAFVDVFTNLAAVVPANPVADTLELVLGMVKDIALGGDRDALPGVAAMDPDGPYLAELNGRPDCDVRYHAIAADFEPINTSSKLLGLRDRLFDRVFDGAMNDLVVPTRSTYLAVGSFSIPADHRFVLDNSFGIDHSSFWADRSVITLLDSWLEAGPDPDHPAATSPDSSDAEADIETAMAVADGQALSAAMLDLRSLPSRFHDRVERIVGGPVALAPLRHDAPGSVVLVPGSIGSLLAGDGGRRLWISPWRLARGAFAELEHGEAATSIVPTGLDTAYAPLAAALAQQWDVHLFPYDWRLDIDDAADALDEFIRVRFGDDTQRPVHLVAHAMGGLIARRFASRHADTWQRIDHDGHVDGGRLVMLGTPHRGSYAVPLAFAGEDSLAKGIAAIDPHHDRRQIGAVVASFPGMYQLLPTPLGWSGDDEVDDDRARLYETSTWGRTPVRATWLERAKHLHAELAVPDDDATLDRMVSIVGDRELTPANLRIDDGRQLYGRSDRGDGRVLHRSAVLDSVTTHYVEATHGGLVVDDAVLGSINDILRLGKSSSLATTPMARRDGDGSPAVVGGRLTAAEVDPEPIYVSTRREVAPAHPTGSDLQKSVEHSLAPYLGLRGTRRSRHPLRVSVKHASLEQASHPVIVGHYRGLPPQGAENFLDRRLDGALRRHHELADYPREVGESLFVEADGRPPGGIVIGLGPFGELTRSKLVRSVKNAIVQRVLRAADLGETGSVGVSTVLVSTPGQYGLSIATAVAAIVEGAAAAIVELDRLDLDDLVFEELELIELYEVRAAQALEHLRRVPARLSAELQQAVDFHVLDRLLPGRGGRPGMPMAATAAQGWPRFVVDRLPPSNATDDTRSAGARTTDFPRFEFTRVGRGAQVDRLLVEYDEAKVTAMIDAAIHDPSATDAAFALFEMLFPHHEKLEIDDTDNLHLLVDEETAAIPWELLCGRGDGHPSQALAMRSGLLRQIRPSAGGQPVRRSGRPPVGLRALVVGDPPAGRGRARLYGAREEARAVARKLEDRGYAVTQLVYDDDADPAEAWLEIQTALYREPYRVIHFATHGVVDREHPERTGLLIGPQHRLTALDFQQMSVTPDFAFLNACHVGRLQRSSDDADPQQRTNELAANLGLQLMSNGVRAVVAAGWAVDDRSALTFADTLYDLLLDGRHYGDAVHEARVATFDGGRTNTWGAYQCYGDPSFFLNYQPAPHSRIVPVSAGQLVEMLDAFTSQAGDSTDMDSLAGIHREVCDFEANDLQRFPTVEVYEAFGNTYAALGCYTAAVWAFREAIRCDEPTRCISPATLERLSNMEVYLALDRQAGRRELFPVHHESSETAVELFESARTRLQGLIDQGPTHQRESLLGSLHKKRAATFDDHGDQIRSIDLGVLRYRRAFALELEHSRRIDAYTGLTWVQLAQVRDRIDGADRPIRAIEREIERDIVALIAHEYRSGRRFADTDPELMPALLALAGEVAKDNKRPSAELEAAHTAVREQLRRLEVDIDLDLNCVERHHEPDEPPPDLWTDNIAADIQLTLVFLDGGVSTERVATAVEQVGDRYLEAFANRSTVRFRLSVAQHIVDLAGLWPTAPPGDERADLRALLHGLAKRLAPALSESISGA